MTVEDGLWYCPADDAYHGEADEPEEDLDPQRDNPFSDQS